MPDSTPAPGQARSGSPGSRGSLRRALRWRPLRLAGIGSACIWLFGAAVARSDPNFGTLGLDRTRYGAVVSIRTPAADLFQPADEFVVQRDVVQSENSDPGLIQAGLYRSGDGIALDNCGAHTSYVIYTEVKVANSMAYRCQLYHDVAPGSIVTLDIFRFTSPGTWGLRINGTPTGSIYRVGFTRGAPAIGTEIQSAGASFQSQTSTQYEPPGGARWTVYTTTGRHHPRRVTSHDSLSAYPMLDHLWKIARPPARVSVKHRHA